ncbi:MAG: adenosylmethionine decarboxylase [SAR202 cluster bacterium]|nr:adenosylmethionine decarboxylase [Chloroflexota bacterium]MDP6422277.1 adenosylmethionine decarboxylase [SAR202 cluster bacterium]MQG57019.1 adenosylmethionine decarboxylase [SAR202 cluster bacterium]MQG69978.1 adenosylmethionine decarboxylase [SAR202 cluster bacterium]
MNALGRHLLLELKECNRELLDDLDFVRQAMLSAANEAGATVVGESFHKFNPVGVTGIVAIAESHLCIHTWPEYGYAAADVFTCGEEFDPRKAADILIGKLGCSDPVIEEVQRGLFPQGDAQSLSGVQAR